jgi:serine/threonine protein kinase
VAKFYPNKQTAENAVKQQKDILAVLKKERDPEIFEGCCGPCGLYVVIEKFITSANVVTRLHMINLTIMVDLLHSNGFVHGDLRPQNIVFEDTGTVTLIDFEWAGTAGIAKFPVNVSAGVFGEAGRYVYSDGRINRNFDWYCLAEIMTAINCPNAARAAKQCRKDAVVSALGTMPIDSDFSLILLPLSNVRRYLNLSGLDKRLNAYYADKRKRGGSQGGSDESEVDGAAKRRPA